MELGYVEGKTSILDCRSAEGQPARLADVADELVRSKPDVIWPLHPGSGEWQLGVAVVLWIGALGWWLR